MPAQPDSALKLWKSAFCPASGFHLSSHFRILSSEVGQGRLCQSAVGCSCEAAISAPALQVCRKSFAAGVSRGCFRFPKGVKPCWAYNACHCTLQGTGSMGWIEPNSVVMKGFIHQWAKPLGEPVYLVARKGTLSRELIQKWKASHGSSAGYTYPRHPSPSWNL